MGRKLARESAMKLIFQLELTNDFSNEAVDVFIDNNGFDQGERAYIIDAVNIVRENKEEIDCKIEAHSSGWKINRLAKVDLSILRIALYELFYREDIPIKVSINEALEMSKKYSGDESTKFINGILGTIVRECPNNEE